ncbi:MAG: dipeptidase [Deltaproteobacteria bacterium]|jgi:membrane dipeptidase
MRYPLLALAALVACKSTTPPAATPATKSDDLAHATIIADGHVDLPYRMRAKFGDGAPVTEDLTVETEGDFDFVRAKAGGLDAPFMSIYVPAKYQETGGAKAVADELIDMIEGFEKRWPERVKIAHSVADVEAAFAAKKIALPMGIENGAAIEDDLANVAHFHRRGVRYVTLTHSKDNQICDSSYDETRTHKGLSDFGRQVVAEMNRVGIMVDVSHVSDDTFHQVIALSKAPVIASHSSCRHFTPGFERNMSDDMIRALADKEGVILINFGSTFISQKSRDHYDVRREARNAFMKAEGIEAWDDPKVKAWGEAYDAEHPKVLATIDDVVDHIDHVAKLVGVDHVGFGSDFDGVGDTLPVGLEDASKYPALITKLLAKGYSEDDVKKIAGGNFLRVWRAVEANAEK